MTTDTPTAKRFNERVRACLADSASHYRIPTNPMEAADHPKPVWLIEAIQQGIIITQSPVNTPELDCYALATDSRRQWLIPGEHIVHFPSGALLLINQHSYNVITTADEETVSS